MATWLITETMLLCGLLFLSTGRFCEHAQQQKAVLRRQAAVAAELDLPIVIHSRDSERDIIEELEQVCENSPIFKIISILYFRSVIYFVYVIFFKLFYYD